MSREQAEQHAQANMQATQFKAAKLAVELAEDDTERPAEVETPAVEDVAQPIVGETPTSQPENKRVSKAARPNATRRELAKKARVGMNTMQQAHEVHRKAPELLDPVAKGTMSLPQALC